MHVAPTPLVQARQRAQAVMYRAVDRLATRTTRAAFTAWLGHVRARRARKTAIARYLQRWASFTWQGLAGVAGSVASVGGGGWKVPVK